MSDLQLRFETANAVMEEAALLARQLFARRDSVIVEQKSANDFVSGADRQVEQLIRDRLKDVFPDDAILGEEMGGEVGDSFWSIDPIDGTTNFFARLAAVGDFHRVCRKRISGGRHHCVADAGLDAVSRDWMRGLA
ncbi:inositol monophosphatase family protein [Dickeya ananatis]